MARRADDLRRLDERILFVAPTRRDAEVTWELLSKAQLASYLCTDLTMLAARVAEGVGAVMLTDDALADPAIADLHACLERQPPWSDVPVLVLARDRAMGPTAAAALMRFANLTLLDRPVSTRALVSAAHAALRARRRQYQIREQIERQLAAETALREADQRKDEFLATLAHELRNPLAPIRTALHVLDKLPGDAPQAAKMRQMMQRQVGRLVRLIDELLDVARIATGKVVLQRERIDLRAVVATALEDCAPLVEAARHELRWQPPPEPVWVVGDAARLAQVVANLVSNAAKYTPAGGRVEVGLRRAGSQALVGVSDNGLGIPREMLDEVFEMFAQVDRTRERSQGGLGIGLSLVRRLVELHGGSVGAASEGADRGSTFTVRLPAVDAAGAAPSPEPDAAPVPPTRRVRVLVVDDNVDAADALALHLAASGHAVRTAYGGAAALEIAQAFEPELVLCDIGMPGLDGHEVARRLRADPHHAATVLVALTGWGSEEDRRRTRATGFDLHLVKPVPLEAVDRILARL